MSDKVNKRKRRAFLKGAIKTHIRYLNNLVEELEALGEQGE